MRKYISVCLTVLLLLFVASCTNDDDAPGGNATHQIGIKITIDKEFATTRSTEMGEDAESLVSKVTVLVYNQSSNAATIDDLNAANTKLEAKYTGGVSELEKTAYGYYYKLARPLQTGKKLYYVIANPTYEIENMALGTSLSELRGLYHDYISQPASPFLMEGFILGVDNSSSHDYEVDVKRTVSKIRLNVKFTAQPGLVPQYGSAKVKVTNLFSQPYQVVQQLPPSNYAQALDLVYDWSATQYTASDCSFECYIPAPPVENSSTGEYPVVWLQLPVQVNGVLHTKNYYKIAIDPKLPSCDAARNVIYDIDLQLKGLGTENENSDLVERNLNVTVTPWTPNGSRQNRGLYISSQTGGTVCFGNYPATFAVTAKTDDVYNSNVISYQWYINGEQLSGATSNTYNWVPDGKYTEGYLYCVASMKAHEEDNREFKYEVISKKITIKPKTLPNCFMVSPYSGGTVEFPLEDAVAMGWATGSLTTEDLSDASLVILWKTSASISLTSAIVDNKTTCSISVGSSYTELGNAVVALKVKGKIVWSWHLWMTNYQPEVNNVVAGALGYTWMGINLGAKDFCSPDIPLTAASILLDTYGLYYQWGRKDPFIGPNYYNQGYVDSGSNDNLAAPVFYGSSDVKFEHGGTITIPYSIQNPCRFYSVGDANIPNNAWGNEDVKSIFDPCPEGWRVPSYQGIISPWNGVLGSYVAFGLIPMFEIGNNNYGYLPATGYYSWNSWQYGVGNIKEAGEKGSYWTALNYGSDNTKAQHITFGYGGGTYRENDYSFKTVAMPIRCVKDEN